MKNYLCIMAFLCTNLSATIATNNPIKVESEIASVTVYRTGAQIKREITVDIPKGKSTFQIRGLESNINEHTIQINFKGDALLESFQYEPYKERNENKVDFDQIQILQDSIKLIEEMSSVFRLEKEMILSNKNIYSEASADFAITLDGTASVFRNRLLEITKLIFNNELKIRKWKVALNEEQKLGVLNKRDTIKKHLTLSLFSEQSYQEKISIQFLISEASWDPFYDVKLENAVDNIMLIQRAKVRQSTGKDWKNIPLTLSTSNPNISNKKPDLRPYYLTFGNYYRHTNFNKPMIKTNYIYGTIADSDGYPLIGATVHIEGSSTGTITDVEGKFTLQTQYGKHKLVISYTGYQSMKIPVTSQNVQVRLQEGEILDEVIVTGSSRDSNYDSYRKKQKQENERPLPIAISNSEISTSFVITHPISIPSKDEDYTVIIAVHEIDASFHYVVVPKVSSHAYLHAKLIGWEELELLDGNGNVYFNDSYEGETYFRFQGESDTLALSIGRDKNVNVKRQLVKDFSKDQFLSKHIKKSRKWKTSILNAKDHEINLVIEDHYPVSKDGDIKVKRGIDQTGFLELENGLLQKKVTLNANEKFEYHLEYEVIHDKNLKLFVE